MKPLDKNLKLIFISSFPPRECGIATFTQDLANTLNNIYGCTLPIEIYALENKPSNFNYIKDVTDVLHTFNINQYRKVADAINERNDVGLICIQHEFGLYGGEYGSHILSFMLAVNKPVITVFHTVLPNPDTKRKSIVQAINNLSEKIIVQTKNSHTILMEDYNISAENLEIIPHGTHIVLWKNKAILKEKYSFKDKIILSTFGLLSENKNVQTVLYALPEVVKKHPNVLFLILGKTHPEVIKNEGEKYREQLVAIIDKLNLQKNVKFINKYLALEELLEYLNLSDIYLFSSKDPFQAVSGTFVYAMSAGCPVISTPIPHAKELIDDSNGILLNTFHDPYPFQKAILELIENKNKRVELGKNAFSKMRATSWQNAAIAYGKIFGEITNKSEDLSLQIPQIKIDHLKEMTTDFGVLQFSNFGIPDPNSGYTLDDNARALIAMTMYYKNYKDEDILKLVTIYLNFIEFAQQENGSFKNYINLDKEFTLQNKEVNLEDSNGRAVWALGFLLAQKNLFPKSIAIKAQKCFEKVLSNLGDFASPRAIGFALKGLYYYNPCAQESVLELTNQLIDKLMKYYQLTAKPDWNWYEDYLTYANSILPEAMMYAFLITKNDTYKEIAEVTFDFLLSQYFMKGKIQVISNKGWFNKRNKRTFFGEQPIEIAYTIFTLELFYEVTKKSKYKDQLEIAFSWFLGNNHLNQIMYNPANGACYDGLEEYNININQGAESSICYVMALMAMDNCITKSTTPYQLKASKLFICDCNSEQCSHQFKFREKSSDNFISKKN